MWIRLKTPQQLSVKGVPTQFYAGDWVEVGRQQALAWIALGCAEVPAGSKQAPVLTGCTIIQVGGEALTPAPLYGVTVMEGSYRTSPTTARTLYWDTSLSLNGALLPIGFSYLQNFQLVVPLYSYELLAGDTGTEADRERSRSLVGSDKVLLYDHRALYLRQDLAERFLDTMLSEDQGDLRHALLRAVALIKPVMLTLPLSWNGHQ